MVFKAAGRHPIAGLVGGFAAVGAGYSTSPLVTSLDALFAGITEAVDRGAARPTSRAPRSRRSRTSGSTSPRRSCSPRWPGFVISRVVEPRLVREGAPTEMVEAERRLGGRRRPDRRRRGGRGRAARDPHRPLGRAHRRRAARRTAGRAGVRRPRRADPGRRAAGRLAVAQRGRRLPAGVGAAGLDGLHRVRALPRPRAGLRLHHRDAEGVRRRAEGDGARHQGHVGVPGAGVHARPVHRAVHLEQPRRRARGQPAPTG